MDYTARIQELTSLKSSITGKVISTGPVDGFSDTVSEWQGSAPDGYQSLVADTQEQVLDVYETKEVVVEAIETRIEELETMIEDQYAANSGIPNMILDDDDAANNRTRQLARIDRISNLDSSVRNRLVSRL